MYHMSCIEQFTDVKDRMELEDVYDGTIFYEHVEGEFSGNDKCLKECEGNCLAYGITGHAWCFPYDE